MRDRPEFTGLLRVVAAATVWGSIPVLVRHVDASPFVIVFWRVVFAGAVLGLYLLSRGRLGEIADLPARKKRALIGMGALLTLNWILFFSALTLTDVAVAVLLAYCGPVFVAALTPVVSREPFDKRVLAPLALALGGTAVIVGPTGVDLGGTGLAGAAMAFASAFTYAILVLNAKRLVQGIPATVYMLFEYLTASALLLPAALLLPGPRGITAWGSLAALGVVNTAATGFLFLSALRAVRADHAAILTYAEPVSATIFAAVFLGERLTTTTVIGGIAVICGGVLVTRLRTGVSVEGPPLLMQNADD